jgi:hypothetical protein
VTYSISLNATAAACRHHACACRIARYTLRSSERGLKRSTAYEASCNPSASETSPRNRSLSFLLSVLHMRLDQRQQAGSARLTVRVIRERDWTRAHAKVA